MSVFDGLLRALDARGASPAVIEPGEGGVPRETSGQGFAAAARALACGLLAAGVTSGERVGLLAPNGSRWLIARFAIAAAGAVAVALDDQSGEGDVAMVVRTSGLRRLISVRSHLPMLAAVGDAGPRELFLLDDDGAQGGAPANDGTGDQAAAVVVSWRELNPASARELPVAADDDVAMLVYTSGTTGNPKPFALRNRHVAANVAAIADLGLIGAEDRLLLPLPLHHVYPFVVGALVPFAAGTVIVFPEAQTGAKIVAALQAARCTAMIGVPRLYEALISGIEAQARARGRFAGFLFQAFLAASLAVRKTTGWRIGRLLFAPVHAQLGGRLRLLVSAGAKLEGEVVWKLEALGLTTLTGYGLAETASAFTGNIPGAQRIGSEGRPFGQGRARIAGANAEGEIQLSGPSVFDGYLDNPEANATAFTQDGWFRTGDFGHIDADGYVFVTGRLKEQIVLGGGKKVFPEELERHYAETPGIAEIAVFALQGSLAALVVPDAAAIRAAGSGSIEDVIRVGLAQRAQSLPAHQRLGGFALSRAPLPRTRLGKYQRFRLPDLYEQAKAGGGTLPQKPLSAEDQALLADPRANAAFGLLRARYPGRPVSLDADPQLDLGIDSLEWLGLGLALEAKLGVRLADQDLAAADSVRSLLRRLVAMPDATSDAGATPGLALALPVDAAEWLAPQTAAERRAFRLLHALNRGLCRLMFRLRASGTEHLPVPPYVIVANHVSDLDPAVLAAALPRHQLDAVWWSGDRGRLFGSPVQRWFARAVHLFPVDERAPATTLAMAREVLDRGQALVWFPESWRSPDGRLQRFLPGIGRLLADRPVPVVPAFIDGTFVAMPRDRRLPRLVPVRIRFAPARDPAALHGDADPATVPTRIADALHQEVALLAGDARPRARSDA